MKFISKHNFKFQISFSNLTPNTTFFKNYNFCVQTHTVEHEGLDVFFWTIGWREITIWTERPKGDTKNCIQSSVTHSPLASSQLGHNFQYSETYTAFFSILVEYFRSCYLFFAIPFWVTLKYKRCTKQKRYRSSVRAWLFDIGRGATMARIGRDGLSIGQCAGKTIMRAMDKTLSCGLLWASIGHDLETGKTCLTKAWQDSVSYVGRHGMACAPKSMTRALWVVTVPSAD